MSKKIYRKDSPPPRGEEEGAGPAGPGGELRLQRFLAMAGLGSRRGCEALIEAGRVRVHGREAAKLGMKVLPGRDRVYCDGKPVRAMKPESILLHKPRNYTCEEDPRRPGKSIAVLYPMLRPFPVAVGLQRNASGIILLSSDGELNLALKRRAGSLERKFNLRVKEKIPEEVLENLKRGVPLDGIRHPLEAISFLRAEEGVHWYQVAVRGHKEGMLDRAFLAVGRPIQRMVQVGIAGVDGSLLPKGHSRSLTPKELSIIRQAAGLS